MTGPTAARAAPVSWRRLVGLAAGLLLLDILVNVPAFSPSAPTPSLLEPSIDLLVLVALCWGIAPASAPARLPLRIGLAAAAVGLMVCAAGLRWGWDGVGRLPGGWAGGIGLVVVAAVAAFALCGLVLKGLEAPLVRSILLLVISLAAVRQVISGRKVFSASVIPRLVALIR